MNADINGAGNIAKKYLETFCEGSQDRPVVGSSPRILKMLAISMESGSRVCKIFGRRK